jgi:pimeloyl-ACP methyl ester carboxylesterase
MFRAFAIFGLLVSTLGQIARADEPVGALRAGIHQRNGTLVQQGLPHPCRLDPARVATHTADVPAGFYWSYLLYTPHEVRTPFLLGVPNNTGFATSDPELLAVDGTCAVAGVVELAERLGTPVLVPLFPRPPLSGEEPNLYLHALTRASLLTRIPEYARVDLQFVAMLDDATRALGSRGINVSHRILLSGFSAAGSFVSRFAMLHPDRVLAVASGSPGGWPIVPVRKDGHSVLPYPVGIADLKSLTGATPATQALKQVAWFFFLGDSDTNDSVPYLDSFPQADENLVFEHFGATLAARWKQAARLYHERGLNAQFKLYRDVAHEVTPQMQADIEAFFVAATQASGSARPID